MTLFIEKLETPAGDALINVPASVQTLKGLGFSDVAAQALIEKAAAAASERFVEPRERPLPEDK